MLGLARRAAGRGVRVARVGALERIFEHLRPRPVAPRVDRFLLLRFFVVVVPREQCLSELGDGNAQVSGDVDGLEQPHGVPAL